MSNRRMTNFTEREQFVQQHQSGKSYAEIGAASGWKPEPVKKHCLTFAQAGAAAERSHAKSSAISTRIILSPPLRASPMHRANHRVSPNTDVAIVATRSEGCKPPND